MRWCPRKEGPGWPQEVGYSAVELDGRFSTVRTRESNLGNFVTDIWREAAHADVVLLNSGSLRSDTLHPPGPIKTQVPQYSTLQSYGSRPWNVHCFCAINFSLQCDPHV